MVVGGDAELTRELHVAEGRADGTGRGAQLGGPLRAVAMRSVSRLMRTSPPPGGRAWITNSRRSRLIALLCKTDPDPGRRAPGRRSRTRRPPPCPRAANPRGCGRR
ncbi:hypothetical protein EEJ42_36880 [Streptomyces botrytidirepellens]|uniref:Uncharacterized protein n=1 Tax=Streptomyces botrytidirepellens TaxID=2486417 RepID=A0A3M8TWC0_9ACTN|nr:hypothetical protein EEJ42_36880 [Streptomyces botrytidirepellens]